MSDDTGQGAAEEWREIGGGFTRRVDGADPGSWDAPAPVDGWRARDVVGHLVEWFPGFLESGSGIRLEVATSVEDDPAAAWNELERGVRDLLDDPATATRVLSNPHIGDVPLDRAVSQFFTADVFMHTWDLARATGQDESLDPERCARMLAGMEPVEEMIRASGQYGPRVAVPADADPQTRLLGFIGRDPGWRAPGRS
ncbi:MAG TPA: TIGR03086 family metal-binding protein [Nocardioides sp.]|uniref:TIGR03086 family metal-binding protein n=1 Tax=Nocardioides sp. TaxID=35761 RepID=UPI002BDDC7C3|nr:TIGR03086 family metal-binding protein [Nocardioides sp.]HTW18018.1 TIGR03086 family metal-binding protein [Nocardioides sp.]